MAKVNLQIDLVAADRLMDQAMKQMTADVVKNLKWHVRRKFDDVVSTITLFDGPVITEIDVLPASASGLLYGGREVEAGSDGSAAPLSRFIGFVVVPGSRVAERPPFACAPASGGCR